MAEKPNKGMVIGIAVAAVAVIAVIIGIVLAKGNEGGVGEGGDGTESGQVEGVNDMDFSELEIRCHVSSGTYIRTLAEDIGEKLGTGAYLTALRRTRVGEYDVKDAACLMELVEKSVEKFC